MNIFKVLKNKSAIFFLNGGFNLSGKILSSDKKHLLVRTSDNEEFLLFKSNILAINVVSSKKAEDNSSKKNNPQDMSDYKVNQAADDQDQAQSIQNSFLNDNVFVVRSKNNRHDEGTGEIPRREDDERCIPIDLTNMRKPDKISGNYDEDFSISLGSLQNVSSQTRPENKK